MNLKKWLSEPNNTQERLADLLRADDGEGVTQGAISHWLRRGVPVARAVQLERVSSGQMKASDLRPDVFGPKTKDVAA